MALSLEQTLSKAEILERYLNLVAFGPSQYGAEAASQWFFGVSADRLTLAQAALLAGMVNNPPKYNPLDENHVQDARDRRDLVLDVMVAAGRLSKATAEETKKQDLGLNPNRTRNGCIPADNSETNGFFCQYALDYLAHAGFDAKTVARSGWTVKTTLDPAVMAVGEGRGHVQRRPDACRASSGSPTPSPWSARTSRARCSRWPRTDPTVWTSPRARPCSGCPPPSRRSGAGSTFKIFTAAAAMEMGLGTNATIDVPAQYTSPLVPTAIVQERRHLSGHDDPRAGPGHVTEHRVRRPGGSGRPAEGRRDGGPARAARLLAGRRSGRPGLRQRRHRLHRAGERAEDGLVHPRASRRSARWSWPTSAPP